LRVRPTESKSNSLKGIAESEITPSDPKIRLSSQISSQTFSMKDLDGTTDVVPSQRMLCLTQTREPSTLGREGRGREGGEREGRREGGEREGRREGGRREAWEQKTNKQSIIYTALLVSALTLLPPPYAKAKGTCIMLANDLCIF
jgi:hypothetical protein